MVTARYHTHAGTALRLGAPGGVDHLAFVLATREAFQALAVVALLAAVMAWLARAGGVQSPPQSIVPQSDRR
jgi:hypothetical protein